MESETLPAPLNQVVGRIRMQPQPVWEEEPQPTSTGTWAGRYRYATWGYSGPEENVDVDEHAPPSPMHRPCTDDGIIWYWTTDPPNRELTGREALRFIALLDSV